MKKKSKICRECGKEFIPVGRQIYCCIECRKEAYKRYDKEKKKIVEKFLFENY